MAQNIFENNDRNCVSYASLKVDFPLPALPPITTQAF